MVCQRDSDAQLFNSRVDRLKYVGPAASTRVGGNGIRYTVMINGRETYLFHEFFEDEGRWFMEIPVMH